MFKSGNGVFSPVINFERFINAADRQARRRNLAKRRANLSKPERQ